MNLIHYLTHPNRGGGAVQMVLTRDDCAGWSKVSSACSRVN